MSEGSLHSVSHRLKYLAKHSNLDSPESVKQFIADKKYANSYKVCLVKAYNYYALTNGLEWVKPKYKAERKLPRIPTKDSIMKVISASSFKYATIFKILMETGVMPYELSKTRLRDIDLDRGVLTVQGFKGHLGRVFKLSNETLAMLKQYINRYYADYPFSESIWISKMWIKYKNRVAEKLGDPSIKTIRLYDLRHYYATMLYYRTKDILLVKQQLDHKKIETTMIYTQLVCFDEEEQFYSATAQTVSEARRLVEQGFEYVTDVDGVKIFKKRK